MTKVNVDLEYPNISLKQYPRKKENLFSHHNCAVAVNYWIYDKRKKTIIDSGSSRACGCNYHKASIHAEQKAIEYLRHNPHKNLQVYIWRWSKTGEMKPTYCCISCSQLVKKYGYENDIFTIKDSIKVSAIIENPSLSLAYKMKYGLLD